jgi:ribosome-binding protein aMBF1 (putative translation factor)
LNEEDFLERLKRSRRTTMNGIVCDICGGPTNSKNGTQIPTADGTLDVCQYCYAVHKRLTLLPTEAFVAIVETAIQSRNTEQPHERWTFHEELQKFTYVDEYLLGKTGEYVEIKIEAHNRSEANQVYAKMQEAKKEA